jgi:formamidopyrimidine-DNA glycosylase
MPELPEVETLARRLAAHAGGRRIRAVDIPDPKLRTPGWRALPGHRVHDVTRLGKQLVVHLERPRKRTVDRWLVVHLRMTGTLYWAPRLDPEAPHLRAWLTLDRGTLHYTDLRRFGRFHLTDDLAPFAPPAPAVDPLDPAFTAATLARLLQGSTQPLKPWLLRQDRLVGLGNIYASEICHRARLHPARPAGSLTRAEVRRLHRATVRVLEQALAASGTIFYAVEAGRRLSGTFREQLAVYGRGDEPCPRCGAAVHRLVQAQRSTFYCPACQGSPSGEPSSEPSDEPSGGPRP